MSESKNTEYSKISITATTYQDYKGIGIPQTKTFDITDWMNEHGVKFIQDIKAITKSQVRELDIDNIEESVPETMFVVHPGQYKKTEDDILTIIDVAIVNSSQAKAIKELIRRAFEDMETTCWDKLVEK